MHLDISKDLNELSSKVADWLVKYIDDVLTKNDRFTIALSGGNTPKKLHQLLASPAYNNKIDWSRIHFFWGDERYVPITDDKSNAKMAFDTLLDHVPVIKEHIHIMRTDIDPQQSAEEYEKILHQYFDGAKDTFDLVLLGLGEDAHTLSLFPGYDIIHEKQKWVRAFTLKEQDITRITLTPPVVNAACRVAFLISGGDKAVALDRVLYGEHDPDNYPAQIIQPYKDDVYYFVNESAAAELE